MSLGPWRIGAVAVVLLGAPALFAAPVPDEIHITGTIVGIDLESRTLAIRDPEGGRVVFEVPEEAEIVLDGEEGAVLEDLFEGDVVEEGLIKPTRSGRYYLVRARVTSPE
ncbi:MAG: hypothetical protein D6718_07240 [Acidobacteria bacterium]|nr:MAG: hypothetical protein D6718_07240 [Acidobacteriota bacterium]